MTDHANSVMSFEEQVSAALLQSAQLAREEAIRHGTGLVVMVDDKLVELTAEELQKEKQKMQGKS